jgi:hypothetical protein
MLTGQEVSMDGETYSMDHWRRGLVFIDETWTKTIWRRCAAGARVASVPHCLLNRMC